MSHQSDLISQDILAYLKQHENKDLLRFLTCGNVDDGKSTLIGRLLYDSKLIYEDQLQAVTRDSKKVGTTGDAPDLALLVDGLQAEREQGITIDVAYRYFSTENVSSSLLIHQDMSNIRVTWRLVHQLLILRLF
jgi:sulfate adenylyltransferase subunit 1